MQHAPLAGGIFYVTSLPIHMYTAMIIITAVVIIITKQ